MKHVITFVALIFFSLSSSAQSGTELELSRTVNEIVWDGAVLGPVPQGKIWKLVGFSGFCDISVNSGSNVDFYLQKESSSGAYITQAQLPLFFNENDEIMFSLYTLGCRAYVSFIEYTVIP